MAGLDEVDAVGKADGHQVALPDADGLQRPGDSVHPLIELAPGHRAVDIGDPPAARASSRANRASRSPMEIVSVTIPPHGP